MIENGINVKEPVIDKETVSFVLSLLGNNKQSFGILGLPRLISQKNISLLLQDAKILPIEKTGAERSIIGLVILSTVDEPNESVLLSLFFKPGIEPETIGYSINQIKDYFLNRGLTKISAVFPNPSETINVMEACGFIKEAMLGSCFKTRKGFQNGVLLSFANDGRKITPLLDSVSSTKTEKAEMDAKRIEALETALKIKETDLEIKQEQLDTAEKTVREMAQNISPEVSDLQEILSLRKEIKENEKQKNKHKEWLEEKNKMLTEAQEKIALLEAELRKQVQKPEKISIVCDEKPAEITSKRQVDSPVEEELKKSLADKGLNAVQLKVLKLVI